MKRTMTSNSILETMATRFDVDTVDGARIAVWSVGNGPGLVLVHGSIADHRTFESLISAVAPDLTVFAMDRRGFGASPDTSGYSIRRDFADVAGVVDAVAAATGGPVSLWGHSYGANCAMGGAALTGNVDHLILHEPSLGLPYPAGSIEAIESALATGDNDAAITAVLVDILESTDDEIDALRASPLWPSRLAAAPTIPRECRADASPDRLGQCYRRDAFNQPGSRGNPRLAYRHPRRARAFCAQDRSAHGRRHHREVHPMRRPSAIPEFVAGTALRENLRD